MYKIKVGQGSCGISAGAAKVYSAIQTQINDSALDVQLSVTGCIGMCYLEPIVDIYDLNGDITRLVRVKESDAQSIVDYIKTYINLNNLFIYN